MCFPCCEPHIPAHFLLKDRCGCSALQGAPHLLRCRWSRCRDVSARPSGSRAAAARSPWLWCQLGRQPTLSRHLSYVCWRPCFLGVETAVTTSCCSGACTTGVGGIVSFGSCLIWGACLLAMVLVEWRRTWFRFHVVFPPLQHLDSMNGPYSWCSAFNLVLLRVLSFSLERYAHPPLLPPHMPERRCCSHHGSVWLQMLAYS